MIPIGGLSLIIHLIVILRSKVRKTLGVKDQVKLKDRKPSSKFSLIIIPLIFAIIFGTIGIFMFMSVVNERHSAINYVGDIMYDCQQIQTINSDKKVIFRVDDIQVNAWEKIQMRLIDDALNRQVPLTLGVIPVGLDSTSKMPSFLSRRSCNVEIALHGYDNQFEEFKNLSYDEAKDLIEYGIESLEENIGQTPTTFIPPNNIMSEETAKALTDLGFQRVSSMGSEELDYDATTYDFTNLELVEVDTILQDCEKAFETQNTCVVMIHPQDYADEKGNLDEEKYKRFTDMISRFKELNVSFIKMNEY